MAPAIRSMLEHDGPFLIDLILEDRVSDDERRSTRRIAPLSSDEIEAFAAQWYRQLDLHAPAEELVAMVAGETNRVSSVSLTLTPIRTRTYSSCAGRRG